MLDSGSSRTSAGADLNAACSKAVEFQLAGQLEDAERLYLDVLRAEPMHAVANHCIGMLKVQTQQPAESLPFLRAALNVNPQIPEYWLGYLEALLSAGVIDDAVETLALGRQYGLSGIATDEFARRLATTRPPLTARAPSTLPGSRHQAKTSTMTRAHRRREARVARELDDALLSLIGQRRFAEALVQARAMTTRRPEHGLSWKILGALLGGGAGIEEAVAAMQTSVRLLPDDAEAHANLGTLLTKLGRYPEAEASLNRALEINPMLSTAHGRLGMTYAQQGRSQEAQASLRTGIALAKGTPEGDGTLQFSNLLFVLSHDASMSADSLFAEHCRFGEYIESPLRATWPTHTNSKDPERCLRVGFVSGDLYNHAVTTFLEPLLAHMSRHAEFELHAYSNNDLEDEVTGRLREYFAQWNSIASISDRALAKSIVDDGIDILIDLSGHTALNRLGTFARKPAPIQVSWMGYPGTTGLTAVDYYLADKFWLPTGRFESQFTEKLAYLPSNVPFQAYATAPVVNSLPALASGAVTFGSFNRLGKINGATIDLWSQLLRAVPKSRLLMAGLPVNGSPDRLVEQFAACGIAAERLHLHPRATMDKYLALHHQVDICLDTYPYTGGTTTNHALWMGVPTLTIAGQTPAAMQGAGILGHLQLEAFVAANKAEFVANGVRCTGNLPALAEVRAGLRDRCRQSPIFQPLLIVDALERALRHMWMRWCAGLPPHSLESPTISSSELGRNTNCEPGI